MIKSCDNCLHKEICKIYHGEMLRRDYSQDFVKELKRLGKELGQECFNYMEKEKFHDK